MLAEWFLLSLCFPENRDSSASQILLQNDSVLHDHCNPLFKKIMNFHLWCKCFMADVDNPWIALLDATIAANWKALMTNWAPLHWDPNARPSPFQLCFTCKQVCSLALSEEAESLPAHRVILQNFQMGWGDKEGIRIAIVVTPGITDQLLPACPMSWADAWDSISPVEAKELGKQEALYTPSIKTVFVWSIASLWTPFLFSFLMTQIRLVSGSDMVLFSCAAMHIFNSSISEALEKLSSVV